MHKSVRGIVKKDDGIILIHRIKKREDGTNREYYVVPGGKMEPGESEEQTVIRELHEELGIKVKPKERLIEYNSDYDDSIQIFYLCEYIEGKLGTGDGPEIKANVGIFEPTIKTIKEIEELNLVPEEIKEFLINKER